MSEFYEFFKNFGFPAGLLIAVLYVIYRGGLIFFDKVIFKVDAFLVDLKNALNRAESHLTRQADSVQRLAEQNQTINAHNAEILEHNKKILDQNQVIIGLVKTVADKVESINVKVDKVVVHAEGPVAIVPPRKDQAPS